MYEIFQKLLDARGVTAYKVGKTTGISTATLTQWKKGKSTPKADKMQKIADYFGVSIEYLMTGENPKEKEALSNQIDEEVMECARKILELGVDPNELEELITFVKKMKLKD